MAKKEPEAAPETDDQIMVEIGDATVPADTDVQIETSDAATDEPQNDPVQALTEQLEASKQAQELDRAARIQAEQRADEALRFAQDRDMRARQAYDASQDAQYSTLQNALQAAQTERDAARARAKAAKETGDYDAEIEAHEILGRASYEIKQYEVSIAQLGEQRRQEAEWAEQQRRNPQPQGQPQQQRQFSPQEIAASIDADQNLLPTEKSLLKQYPQWRTDPKMQRRLQTAYDITIDRQQARGTSAYIDTIKEIMGVKTEQRQVGAGGVSAPVSRDAPTISGKQVHPNRVVLTKADQEIASALGIDLSKKEEREAYARNKRARANEPTPQNVN